MKEEEKEEEEEGISLHPSQSGIKITMVRSFFVHLAAWSALSSAQCIQASSELIKQGLDDRRIDPRSVSPTSDFFTYEGRFDFDSSSDSVRSDWPCSLVAFGVYMEGEGDGEVVFAHKSLRTR